MCLIYVSQMCCVVFISVWFCLMIRHLWCFHSIARQINGSIKNTFTIRSRASRCGASTSVTHTSPRPVCAARRWLSAHRPALPPIISARCGWMEGEMKCPLQLVFHQAASLPHVGVCQEKKISPCFAITALRYCAGLQRHIFNSTMFPCKDSRQWVVFLCCI